MTPEELNEARMLALRIDNEDMRADDILRLASDHWKLLKHIDELEKELEPLTRLNRALVELKHPPVALALHSEPGGFGGHYAVLELVRPSKNGAPAVVASLSMPLPMEPYEEKEGSR